MDGVQSGSGLHSPLQKKPKISNLFNVLSDYEGLTEDEILNNIGSKKTEIPPVVIYIKLNAETTNQLRACTEEDVIIKFRGSRCNVYTKNFSDYNKVLKFAKDKLYEHYTYTPEDQKMSKFVLKNLPPQFTEEEIQVELFNKGLKIHKVVQMKKKIDDNEVKLPMYICTFEAGTNQQDVTKIKYLCHCVIEWLPYENKNNIVQCYKCQGYNHIARNCHRNPKCLKCSGDHLVSNCIVRNESQYKCANCNQNHIASDSSCAVKNKVIQNRLNKAVSTSKHTMKPKQAPEANDSNYPDLPAKKSTPSNSNPWHLNTSSTPEDAGTADMSFTDMFKEMKNLFQGFNIGKLKQVFTNTMIKLRSTKDTFGKIFILAEGLFALFDD